MTFGYGGGAMPDGFSEAVLSCQEAEDCLIPMGITSENVAADFKIPRAVQDEFAAKSFQKAAAAQKAREEGERATGRWSWFGRPRSGSGSGGWWWRRSRSKKNGDAT